MVQDRENKYHGRLQRLKDVVR